MFLLNFPLYVVYKHSLQAKLEEVSTQEMNSITVFCDLHDTEIPLHLFRNVCVFCRAGGMLAMTQLFEQVEGMQLLPVSISHALIAIVCNLKLWLNFRSVVQLFVPLRAKVMRYMCSLSDKELRLPSIRTMAGRNSTEVQLIVRVCIISLFKLLTYCIFRFYVECCEGSNGFSCYI